MEYYMVHTQENLWACGTLLYEIPVCKHLILPHTGFGHLAPEHNTRLHAQSGHSYITLKTYVFHRILIKQLWQESYNCT